MVELPFEDTVTVPITKQHLEDWNSILQKAFYAWNRCIIYGVISPSASIHGPGSRDGSKNGSTHYHPSDTPEKFLLLVLSLLRSAGLQVLVPDGGVLLPGYTRNIPLTWKLRIPGIRGAFDAIMPIG